VYNTNQSENGPTIGPKHVARIIIQYNLIKYKVVHNCIIYILYYILVYIQHNGDVSLENSERNVVYKSC